MAPSKPVTAALVVIGNEILSGRTRDANLQFLGAELNELGVRLVEARVIPDVMETIVETVNTLRATHAYVFTTGGIGPTHDDITAAAVARAFGLELERNAEAEALLRGHYKPEDVTPARLKMADLPPGAALLENPVSKAPGFRLENVYVLPGVPRIMQAMFKLFSHELVGGEPVLSASITSDVPEGRMGMRLSEIQDRYPDADIGSYPFIKDGRAGACFVVRHPDRDTVNAAADEICDAIRAFDSEPFEDVRP